MSLDRAPGSRGEHIELLRAAFPQYKPASLLFALRWFGGDVLACQTALLTSSDSRFWRQFHSCAAGLAAPCGRWCRASMRPAPFKRPASAAAAASSAQATAERLAATVVDGLVEEVLAARSVSDLPGLVAPTVADGQHVAAEKRAVPESTQETQETQETQSRPQRVRPASASRLRSANQNGLGTGLELAELAKGLLAEGQHAAALPILERCRGIFAAELPPDSFYAQLTARRLAAARRAVAVESC